VIDSSPDEQGSALISKIRELCKAISNEEDSKQMASLLDELLRVLDERQLTMSLL
jgi:hypothetical protein